MTHYICQTCGTQYAQQEHPPSKCDICLDERQYVKPAGQEWTTLAAMHQQNFHNVITKEEACLYSITTQPAFAIGQSAYLIQHPQMNVLWDCITYLDPDTIHTLTEKGGIQAIALSHPHYYSSQVEWAERFDCPIYIHEDDKAWVMRPSSHIQFWSGEQIDLAPGLTLHRLGGHFLGGSVLHWAGNEGGLGALFTGDIIQSLPDLNWVSFMYSYPNLIPLPAIKVREMADRVGSLTFETLYHAFKRNIKKQAHEVIQRSATRYIEALTEERAPTHRSPQKQT
ncbi:MBL fold metallo-hydrolase [Hazenella sp. IB182357]|uniref:MBL fold metallo-hydrolase n=1 Tax=Polycladospora coralii TaxID=2771432 RepID=A0A926N9I1_9BACL|nr:MBL fold metallo-hydrolase [Polycladospora coralii]MBD1371395.1 MBL fold metallo-hydrolase [Polycladospora coralii]